MEDELVKDKLTAYLKNMPTWVDPHSSDYNLLNSGVIDSINIIQLVIYIESEFDVQVESRDLINDNFKTVENMVRFISKRKLRSLG